MNLILRYKKLTFWNKIALWGSLASIVALVFTFLPKKQNMELIKNAQEIKSVLDKQLSLQENLSLTEQNKAIVEYNQLISKFTDIIFKKVFAKKKVFLKTSKEQRKEALNTVESVIDNVLINSIVINSDSYFKTWQQFRYFDFESFKSIMVKHESESTVNAKYYGKQITSGKELLNESFEEFRKRFGLLMKEISAFSNMNAK